MECQVCYRTNETEYLDIHAKEHIEKRIATLITQHLCFEVCKVSVLLYYRAVNLLRIAIIVPPSATTERGHTVHLRQVLDRFG